MTRQDFLRAKEGFATTSKSVPACGPDQLTFKLKRGQVRAGLAREGGGGGRGGPTTDRSRVWGPGGRVIGPGTPASTEAVPALVPPRVIGWAAVRWMPRGRRTRAQGAFPPSV